MPATVSQLRVGIVSRQTWRNSCSEGSYSARVHLVPPMSPARIIGRGILAKETRLQELLHILMMPRTRNRRRLLGLRALSFFRRGRFPPGGYRSELKAASFRHLPTLPRRLPPG